MFINCRRHTASNPTVLATLFIAIVGGFALAMTLTGCSAPVTGSMHQQMLRPTTAPVMAICQEVNGRADSRCTPGLFAHSPEVAADEQFGYSHTICQRLPKGSKDKTWTQKRRPPDDYTDHYKMIGMALYGLPGGPDDYEEDHVGPLSLDGDPGYRVQTFSVGSKLYQLPANLFPQKRHGVLDSADAKDKEEALLHKQVCSDGLSLEQAQAKIIRDWVHNY